MQSSEKTKPFNYCPACGSSDISFSDMKKLVCRDCSLTYFQNVAAAAAAILEYDKKVVLIKRVIAVNIPDQEMKERLTLTAPIINLGRNVSFILFGEKKADTLKKVIEGQRNPDLLPAQLIAPEDGQLQFLVDQSAASLLTAAG